MKEEPINPGYINQIFDLEDRRTAFNRSEFYNATVEANGLDFSYETIALDGFLRLRINIKYLVSAIESGKDLEVINFHRGFKVTKVIDIFPEDLIIVLEHCVSILNLELKEQNPPLKYLPEKFPIPLWENHMSLLYQIAHELNDKGKASK